MESIKPFRKAQEVLVIGLLKSTVQMLELKNLSLGYDTL